MILELIIMVFLLGGDTHQKRADAFEKIVTSEYTFQECREIYDHKDIQKDPEIKLSLKEILWIKYSEEYGEVHRNYYEEINQESLKAAFDREMEFGSK